MTTRRTASDEQIIDQLLLETGNREDEELTYALLQLRSFAGGPVPAPSAALSAVMDAGPASLDARRRRRPHRRTALTALTIAATMGIGTAAAAATDPAFRETAQQAIITVIDTVTQGNSGNSGKPAHAPGHRAPQVPGRGPGLPAPAKGTPGRPGTPPASPGATEPARGTTGDQAVPSGRQRSGNQPTPAPSAARPPG
jgi:hypothetical protein